MGPLSATALPRARRWEMARAYHFRSHGRILKTEMSDGKGGTTVVKYDVPLVKSDGNP